MSERAVLLRLQRDLLLNLWVKADNGKKLDILGEIIAIDDLLEDMNPGHSTTKEIKRERVSQPRRF